MMICSKEKVLVAVLVAGMMAASSQAAYLITKQGKKIEGTQIRSKSNGDVILTTSKGPLTFTRGSYKKAVADEPKEYRNAQRLAAAGKYDEAIRMLNGIMTNYRGLGWDTKAMLELPKVYAMQGSYDKARKAYEEIFRKSPKAKELPDILWPYREVLLGGGDYALLEPELNKSIASGSRQDAARAQNMRGDIRMAQGQLEPAVLDYMRTMVFYKDVPEYQPEAMFKAAAGLEQMRDERARDMYRQVVESYPDSPYAGKAKQKI